MSAETFISRESLPKSEFLKKLGDRRLPLSFELEVTARCNNNCRHCYINLPAGDRQAQQSELSLAEIGDIADQAVKLGAIWCLVTGGEPLLRKDFADLYISLKKKGLVVSVFTNACLVNEDHVALFKKYPPQDIEVSVYGVTKQTYERVTGRPGSYAAFRRGLALLLDNGIKVRLKAMALRSNLHELGDIAAFCRQHTADYFRFDPLLHLRYDLDPRRNAAIIGERLTPGEIVEIEQADEERARALQKGCETFIFEDFTGQQCDHLFHCGAGKASFTVSYDGTFRLCADLWHPDCIFDLRQGSLSQAWNELVPRVRELRSTDPQFLDRCRSCPVVNLCLWCPAHAYLECGRMDGWSEYFCQVAHARARAIQDRMGNT